jgi:hypothetical protein
MACCTTSMVTGGSISSSSRASRASNRPRNLRIHLPREAAGLREHARRDRRFHSRGRRVGLRTCGRPGAELLLFTAHAVFAWTLGRPEGEQGSSVF